MKKIKEFNKSTVAISRVEIQKKLDELKELGLEIKLGNINYRDDSFTSKIEVRLENVECPYVSEFKRSSAYIIHGEKILGAACKLGAGTFTFVGLKPRARKNNAVIRNLKGELRVCIFNSLQF